MTLKANGKESQIMAKIAQDRLEILDRLKGAAAYLDHAAMRLLVAGDEQNAKVLEAQAKASRDTIAKAMA